MDGLLITLYITLNLNLPTSTEFELDSPFTAVNAVSAITATIRWDAILTILMTEDGWDGVGKVVEDDVVWPVSVC